jgi:hypothetical protein
MMLYILYSTVARHCDTPTSKQPNEIFKSCVQLPLQKNLQTVICPSIAKIATEESQGQEEASGTNKIG